MGVVMGSVGGRTACTPRHALTYTRGRHLWTPPCLVQPWQSPGDGQEVWPLGFSLYAQKPLCNKPSLLTQVCSWWPLAGGHHQDCGLTSFG